MSLSSLKDEATHTAAECAHRRRFGIAVKNAVQWGWYSFFTRRRFDSARGLEILNCYVRSRATS
nr:MAG TPA: hypothetical protein [Caudoviricetes sp.]